MLNPRNDTLSVYDQAGGLAAPTILRRDADDHLDGGTVLRGFRVPLTALFRHRPAAPPAGEEGAGRP